MKYDRMKFKLNALINIILFQVQLKVSHYNQFNLIVIENLSHKESYYRLVLAMILAYMLSPNALCEIKRSHE